MKKSLGFLIFTILTTACSQESKPYVETNDSISKQEQGYIETH